MQEIFSEPAKGDGKLFLDSLADDFCRTMIDTTPLSKTCKSDYIVVERRGAKSPARILTVGPAA
jgi:hypothetical protein